MVLPDILSVFYFQLVNICPRFILVSSAFNHYLVLTEGCHFMLLHFSLKAIKNLFQVDLDSMGAICPVALVNHGKSLLERGCFCLS